MTMPFTDHHIQDSIIASLVESEQRFSDLVPEGMEHSLFMYHMRKLIKQGLIEKNDQMYCLTLKGAQSYNARHSLKQPLNYPRALIQFLIVDGDKILLSKRTTSISKQLNEYMLPGGMHYFMAPSRTAAGNIARLRGFKAGEFVGSLETIAVKHDYHGLIDIYTAQQLSDTIKPQAEHELVWLRLEEVAAMDFSNAGSAAFVAANYLSDNLLPRMTWVVDKNT